MRAPSLGPSAELPTEPHAQDDADTDAAERARLEQEIAQLETSLDSAQVSLQNKEVIVIDPSCPERSVTEKRVKNQQSNI